MKRWSDSVSAALVFSIFSKNVRAAGLRVLSVRQVGRRMIWKASPSWKVLILYVKLKTMVWQ